MFVPPIVAEETPMPTVKLALVMSTNGVTARMMVTESMDASPRELVPLTVMTLLPG